MPLVPQRPLPALPSGILDRPYDVAVIGGGNAGLCAALTAAAAGVSVVVIESAPRHFRGGNSRHTRNLRCAHDRPTDLLRGVYDEKEFLQDLMRVTGGQTDEALASLVVRESARCPDWMRAQGVRLQSSLRGTLHLDRTNAFFVGGGKALLHTYYAAAARAGVTVVYDAEVVALDMKDATLRGVDVKVGEHTHRLRAHRFVLAAGGFEANLEWLKDVWGPAADNFIVRGTPYNRGTVLKLMLDAGAQPVGDPTQCHAVAIDARSPKFDGGIVTRLDCVSLGIVVNSMGRRFYDEGEDFWPKRYAIWGRLVAHQPGSIAYSILDAKVSDKFMPSVFPPITARSLPELARQLNLCGARLEETIAEYNAAVREGTFDHSSLDNCRTEGLTPPKSHWAQRVDTPPFSAFPLRPGITFTYLGVRVDERARVLMCDATPSDNIFAAGEIMAGNILGRGYIAGVGMTIGTVFGRLAGGEAAARGHN